MRDWTINHRVVVWSSVMWRTPLEVFCRHEYPWLWVWRFYFNWQAILIAITSRYITSLYHLDEWCVDWTDPRNVRHWYVHLGCGRNSGIFLRLGSTALTGMPSVDGCKGLFFRFPTVNRTIIFSSKIFHSNRHSFQLDSQQNEVHIPWSTYHLEYGVPFKFPNYFYI